MIHTVKSFGIVKKAEINVFLEFSCFFDDPMDVGNLISGSSVCVCVCVCVCLKLIPPFEMFIAVSFHLISLQPNKEMNKESQMISGKSEKEDH